MFSCPKGKKIISKFVFEIKFWNSRVTQNVPQDHIFYNSPGNLHLTTLLNNTYSTKFYFIKPSLSYLQLVPTKKMLYTHCWIFIAVKPLYVYIVIKPIDKQLYYYISFVVLYIFYWKVLYRSFHFLTALLKIKVVLISPIPCESLMTYQGIMQVD